MGHCGRCVFVAISVVVTLFVIGSSNTLHGQASTAGGFIDSATSVGLRPRFSAAQIHAWLPARGLFTEEDALAAREVDLGVGDLDVDAGDRAGPSTFSAPTAAGHGRLSSRSSALRVSELRAVPAPSPRS